MFSPRSRLASALGVVLLLAGASHAQSPAPHLSRTVPVQGARDFAELERLAMAEVPYIRKLEVRDLLLKVDGFDEQGMKVKLYMDRRTGAVLSRELKYDKHGPFGKHGWQHPHGAYRSQPGAWPQPPARVQP